MGSLGLGTTERRGEAFFVAILLLVAAGIGLYLVATMTVISRDGVYYIEWAQKFRQGVHVASQERPFGYPLMIYLTHGLLAPLGKGSSTQMWILSAQLATLASRVLSLLAIYLIGRHFVGPRTALLGLGALIFLPDPARLGSDALRDWPAILFLTVGFLLLIRADDRPGHYGWAGLVCGLGFMVRTETAQLLLYGLGWLALGALGKGRTPRKVALRYAGLLLLGFAVPTVFYLWSRGGRLPYEFQLLFGGGQANGPIGDLSSWTADRLTVPAFASASFIHVPGADLVRKILAQFGENLLWIYLPALVVGLVYRLPRRAGGQERFFISWAVGLAFVMFAVRYYRIGPEMSPRYVLPLLAILFFYVAVGLRVMGIVLQRRLRKCPRVRLWMRRCPVRWYVLLLVLGIVACFPKLFEPPRTDKLAYRQTADWLVANTSAGARVASEDSRICFYAQRQLGDNESGFDYAVRILKKNDPREIPAGWQVVYRAAIDARGMDAVIVYQTPERRSRTAGEQ